MIFMVMTTQAQDFIVEWTFSSGRNSVFFGAETAGPVNYTWTAMPSGNTGTGSFSANGAVTLTGINVPAGNTLTVSLAPANLRRFHHEDYWDSGSLTDIKQWGAVQWSSMRAMFFGCSNLPGFSATDTPDLSNVTNMSFMFWGATSFNQPIGNWNVSNVTNMVSMFYSASSFNQPIGNWNVSNVTNMINMFDNATSFNQPIGNWNASNVTNMAGMFRNATSFNEPIGNWVLNLSVFMNNMLDNSGMDCGNYSATLIGWKNNNPTVSGRSLGATGCMYGTNAVAARSHLINTQGWNITGDSPSGINCGICTLSTTATPTHTTCGLPNGSATANPSGGSGYTYEWSNGQTTQIINNLAAGSYSVTVTDTDGCTATASTSINSSTGITTTATPTHTTCGLSNGSATATPLGGSGYTYTWSNGGMTQTISNIPSGTYTVTVTASNGCTATASTTANSSTGISTIVTPTHTTCGQNNGSITATPSGGSGYSYVWSNGDTTQTISDLAPGTYTVTVTASSGCTATTISTVNSSTVVTVTATVTHESCNTCADGTITLNPQGALVYTYLWNDGATTQTLTGLAPGTYTVTVTGDTGCTATISATVNQFGCNTVTLDISVTDPLCFDAEGIATVSATGGTAPYTYLWSNGDTLSSVTVKAGTYTVSATDHNGCVESKSVTVQQPLPITAQVTTKDETCTDSHDGTASVQASGGHAPYTYTWSNGSSDSLITNLSPGIYTVTVTDANDCQTIATSTILAAEAVSATISGDTLVCFDQTGTLTASVGFTSYLWNTGDTTQTLTWTASGTYGVTVTNAAGCSGTAGIDVAVNDTITVEITKDADTLTTQVTGGTSPYTYLWNTGDKTAGIAPTASGIYTVTITDAIGCQAEDMIDFTVAVSDQDAVAFIIYPNPAMGTVFIETPVGMDMNIVNILGVIVATEKLHPGINNIDVSGLYNGLYFLQTDKGMTVKLIKE